MAWFSTDEDAQDYLRWWHSPDGFVCPGVVEETGEPAKAPAGNSPMGDTSARRAVTTSITAGTVFDGTRLALTMWFHGLALCNRQGRRIGDGTETKARTRQLPERLDDRLGCAAGVSDRPQKPRACRGR